CQAAGEVLAAISGCQRQQVGVDRLIIGLKCGGSDGLSGITANPLLGLFSERLVSYGGAVAMTEIPEMFGAEHILAGRAVDEGIRHRYLRLVADFRRYYTDHGLPVDENPSPGNKQGGITTLAEKSLGCVKKAGNCQLTDVLPVGEPVSRPGLSVVDGPGNDMIAVTNLAAAGCQLILFTTGRGTPLGTVVPVVKVASNPGLAMRKPHWIDFSAGGLLEGEDWSELAEKLWQDTLGFCSGRPVRAEDNGFYDIAIFKTGVTL
ncbi:MAG: UxaA family hydrolase, partial [Negativicutes bacterium]|nr:UxaA family hydrolase [Negativicutes bacterium]